MLNWAKQFTHTERLRRERDGAGGGAGEMWHGEKTLFSVTVGGVLCVQQVPGEMVLLSQDSEMILQQVRFCFQIFIDSQLKTN